MQWPGTVTVTVSVVHGMRGELPGKVKRVLDNAEVTAIDSRLQPELERGDAVALASNVGGAVHGVRHIRYGIPL